MGRSSSRGESPGGEGGVVLPPKIYGLLYA